MVAPSPPSLAGPLVGGPSPAAPRTRRRMSAGRRAAYAVAAPTALGLMRLLWSTYRLTVNGEEVLERLAASRSPCILTLWHDSILVCALHFRRLSTLGLRVTYLVSPSVDGELAALMLARIDGRVVRGSATRSGVKALHGLYRAIRSEGASPLVAPDGPHGPRHHSKPGVLILGRLSGAPLVPVACAASRAVLLPTWDRLTVPWPFARVTISIGEPIRVVADASEEALERERVALEDRLRDLEEAARRSVAARD